jgi:hypothetical protein
VTGKASGKYSLYLLGNGGGVNLSNVPITLGASDLITTNPAQVNFTASESKALSLAILGQVTVTKLPRTATFNTTAPAGVALKFAYDPSADAFSYTHSGVTASYTLNLSTLNAAGETVEFTTKPLQINAGETHTITPTWTQLSTANGTVQIRNAAGAITSHPMN